MALNVWLYERDLSKNKSVVYWISILSKEIQR